MDGLNRLFSNDNAPLRALRDLGLGVVDRAPWLKRALVREAAERAATSRACSKARGCDRLALVEFPRFLMQHNGNAVADRIGKPRGAADQLLALGIIVERRLGQGTDQDLEQLRIEAALAAARIGIFVDGSLLAGPYAGHCIDVPEPSSREASSISASATRASALARKSRASSRACFSSAP